MHRLFLTCAAFSMAVMLSSCSSAASSTAAASTAAAPTAATAVMTTDEVEVAFSAAEAAAEKFWLMGFEKDTKDQKTDSATKNMYVALQNYKTMADFKTFLMKYFSNDVVTGMLNDYKDTYQEMDGKLYMVEAGIGKDITKGAYSATAVQDSAEKYTVTVTVEDLDPTKQYAVTGSEKYTFTYALTDGSWVFTEFSRIY